jgi:subfamily B ATP-binding cassette protein MsbA|tara:strand:- start:21 stop:1787 length:1767 start_codon:yes stop_codon:yes gene_type:complete
MVNSWQIYKRLLRYVRPYLAVFIVSVVGYITFASTSVLAARWLGWTVDAIENNDSEWRLYSPLLCVLIALIRGLGGFLGNYSIAYIANHLIHNFRSEIIRRVLVLPVNFFDRSEAGRLISKITYDVTQVTGAVTNAVTVILREGLTVVGLLGALILIDWQLSLMFLIIAPIVAKTVAIAAKKFRKYSTQMQNSMGDVTQITTESIRGHLVVRTFNAIKHVVKNFEMASERNRSENMKMAATEAISTPLIQLLVSIAIACLVWFSMAPSYIESRSSGEFVAFLAMASLLAKPIRQLSQINSVIQRGLAAAASIFNLLDEPAEPDQGTEKIDDQIDSIRFLGVSFKYQEQSRELNGKEAIKTPFAVAGINFEVRAGEKIAFVGKSGSGKSTLLSLIPRFYEKSAGEIFINDKPISKFSLTSLRSQIALVSQDVVLFNGSILENICYGKGDSIDRDRAYEAAKSAHAIEFIEKLPDQFEHKIGDHASLLSGGQRQRLAIARALYKDAQILILDEATSALDSESETYIQEALRTLMAGRTTFIIAHRLSTIESSDKIMVMEGGEIIESGTHQELINNAGHYAYLNEIQFRDL